ncbi:MAG: Gfo/Idh/MocA family oxidoreductase [Kiritimatiellae bacterium]|nr:Gfo/Idh/MocA family oxidoreductase [Kiritimatiellia bacterium]
MRMTRREMLKASSAFAAFNIIPAKVLFGAEAPSNQLTRALIGYGAIARHPWHLKRTESRLIGLCDPFAARVKQGQKEAEMFGWGKIKAYENFIKLLEDKSVDIVHICTPPHWHACQTIMAARAGKDVWCEKPMTRTVGEGKRVMEYLKSKGTIFRLNTWFRFRGVLYGFGTTVKPIRQIVENGLLGNGPVTCTFGIGQGFSWKFDWSGRVNQNVEPLPDPKVFDYEMWLGPAPYKPYNSHRVGTSFRGYWDYDAGGLGDMAQHYLDPVQYLLCKDDTSPVKIDYVGPKQHPEAVGRFDRITLTYDDGTKVILDGDETLKEEPLLRGSNGLCVYKKLPEGKTFRLKDDKGWWPEEKVLKLLEELPEPAAQETDFFDCVRNRKTFALNESNGFRSCTMFNLGIVAERLGRGFEFDPVTLRAKNDEAADRFLYQEMRQPWQDEFMKA